MNEKYISIEAAIAEIKADAGCANCCAAILIWGPRKDLHYIYKSRRVKSLLLFF